MTKLIDAKNQQGLRLFLDTAECASWARWLPTGLFHGVTTNPTLLERAGLQCTMLVLKNLISEAFQYPILEVQAQCWGTHTDALIETGRALAALDPRVVVKVPITFEGVKAVSILHGMGIRTTLTAVYSAHQALTAAAAGSDYVAPYFGRIGDSGRDAFAAIKAMQSILSASGRSTRLLVASLRSPEDLAKLAEVGVDTFTFSPAVAELLFCDKQTAEAAEAFELAAAR